MSKEKRLEELSIDREGNFVIRGSKRKVSAIPIGPPILLRRTPTDVRSLGCGLDREVQSKADAYIPSEEKVGVPDVSSRIGRTNKYSHDIYFSAVQYYKIIE